ncbi:GyrI-like domain-containing protein [Mesonia aestuariivivens]|uniref:GyrI-like domain-containing protein n=1 Tax=Mesonia aestuariivivens TaxID=2796128 RepID=A0ABS6VXQ0_9FLAO|nr:GyrI-like domain-containing protein [Mesonia aestuariivivens]MBW2960304.1 GyrI-like domain-containing protein [Mesonia aestuariivivens]
MQPKIITTRPMTLVGLKTEMNFSKNKTVELWQTFMSKKHLVNAKNSGLFSVEVYPDVSFFEVFNPTKSFEKWAAVEIEVNQNFPKEMKLLEIAAGLYAKFNYRGKPSDVPTFYSEIFSEWFPNSEYKLASCPHFAIMGEKYKGEHRDSEEEIFIPIERKA